MAGRWLWISAPAILWTAPVASPAEAQPPGSWYVAGAATASFLNKPRQTVANAPAPGSTLKLVNSVDSTIGWQAEAGGTLGRFRVEAEVGRTNNKPRSYTVTSPFTRTLPQTGEFSLTRYMANGYYDLAGGPVRPYLGVGVGLARVHVVTIGPRAPFPTETPRTLIDDSASQFGWQAMAGVSVAATRQLAVTVQYRWFDACTLRGHDARGQQFTEKVSGHNIDVGLRFTF